MSHVTVTDLTCSHTNQPWFLIKISFQVKKIITLSRQSLVEEIVNVAQLMILLCLRVWLQNVNPLEENEKFAVDPKPKMKNSPNKINALLAS